MGGLRALGRQVRERVAVRSGAWQGLERSGWRAEVTRRKCASPEEGEEKAREGGRERGRYRERSKTKGDEIKANRFRGRETRER